jgi:hypothetical protein
MLTSRFAAQFILNVSFLEAPPMSTVGQNLTPAEFDMDAAAHLTYLNKPLVESMLDRQK